MNNMILDISENVLNALGWTLLHSVWQGLLLFVVLSILLNRVGKEADRNYTLATGALFGLVVFNIATFFYYFTIDSSPTLHTISQSSIQKIREFSIGNWSVNGIEAGELSFATIINHNMDLILLVWFSGIIIFGLRMLINIGYLYRLKTVNIGIPDLYWQNRISKLSEKMGLGKKVQLVTSKLIKGPATLGHLRPMILIPFSLFSHLSPYEMEAILLHELAHIKRHDYLVNIVQSIIETVLFFNPFVWIISRIIKRERENACDDYVVKHIDSESYAKALTIIQEYRIEKETLLMAAAKNKNELLNRIKRIMEKQVKQTNTWNRLTSGLIVLTAILGISWISPRQSIAERKKEITTYVGQLSKDVVEVKNELLKMTTAPKKEAPNVMIEPVAEIFEGDTTTAKEDSVSKVVMEKLQKELEDVKKLIQSEDFEALKEVEDMVELEEVIEEVEKAMAKNEVEMMEMENFFEEGQFAIALDNMGDFNLSFNGKDIDFDDLEEISFEGNSIILKDRKGANYYNLNLDDNNFSFNYDGNKYELEFDNEKTKKFHEEHRKEQEKNRELQRKSMELQREAHRLQREAQRLLHQREEHNDIFVQSGSGHNKASLFYSTDDEDDYNFEIKELEDMLKEDKLIKNKKNYKLKYNDNGMKVNGKPVDKKTHKKYKKILGDLSVEIEKNRNLQRIKTCK